MSRLKRENESLKRRLSDAEGDVERQMKNVDELARKIQVLWSSLPTLQIVFDILRITCFNAIFINQDKDRDLEKMGENMRKLEQRAKSGWDAKARADEEFIELQKKEKQKKKKLQEQIEELTEQKRAMAQELEKLKSSGT